MTMFEELFALAGSATLTLTISADDKTGRMTINVIPKPRQDADEPALTKALSLTALPAEFDAQFVQTLRDYREARQSLAEQAQATQEVLQAAKAASAKKAGEAVTKAAKSAAVTTAAKTTAALKAGGPQPADDEGEDEQGNAAQPVATAQTGDAAFDLFG